MGFAFHVVASVLPGLSHLPELRLVTELVHSVGRPFVARAGKIRRLAVSAISAVAATSSRRALIYQCPPRFVDRNSIWQPAQVPEARDHQAFADHGN